MHLFKVLLPGQVRLPHRHALRVNESYGDKVFQALGSKTSRVPCSHFSDALPVQGGSKTGIQTESNCKASNERPGSGEIATQQKSWFRA